jgi:hypothetical protein
MHGDLEKARAAVIKAATLYIDAPDSTATYFFFRLERAVQSIRAIERQSRISDSGRRDEDSTEAKVSKHTPGPWHHSCGRYVYAYHQGEFGYSKSRVVASVPDDELDGGEEEQQANARLIAAAPETAAERDRLKEVNAELLAALRAMLSVVGCGTALDCSVCNSARAAISKAEGKS